MKSSDVHKGLECLVYEGGLWVAARVLGIHKPPGVVRTGPRRYDLLILNGSQRVVREAKQLEPIATPPTNVSPPEPTPGAVLGHMIDAQRRRTLNAAEQLLSEATAFVERLRKGDLPSTGINVNTVNFLLTDYAQLLTLCEVLDKVIGEPKRTPRGS